MFNGSSSQGDVNDDADDILVDNEDCQADDEQESLPTTVVDSKHAVMEPLWPYECSAPGEGEIGCWHEIRADPNQRQQTSRLAKADCQTGRSSRLILAFSNL